MVDDANSNGKRVKQSIYTVSVWTSEWASKAEQSRSSINIVNWKCIIMSLKWNEIADNTPCLSCLNDLCCQIIVFVWCRLSVAIVYRQFQYNPYGVGSSKLLFCCRFDDVDGGGGVVFIVWLITSNVIKSTDIWICINAKPKIERKQHSHTTKHTYTHTKRIKFQEICQQCIIYVTMRRWDNNTLINWKTQEIVIKRDKCLEWTQKELERQTAREGGRWREITEMKRCDSKKNPF